MTKNEIVSVLLLASRGCVFTLGEADRLGQEGVELMDEQRRRRRESAERELGMTVEEAESLLDADEAWEVGAAIWAF